jgi:hypothetical protein
VASTAGTTPAGRREVVTVGGDRVSQALSEHIEARGYGPTQPACTAPATSSALRSHLGPIVNGVVSAIAALLVSWSLF